MDCKLKIEMVTSVDQKRGSVFSHGGGGFRIAQCPHVSIVVREFCPLQGVEPGGIMMKKDSDCNDVMEGVKHL